MYELLDMLRPEVGTRLKCHIKFICILPDICWSDIQFLQQVVPLLHRCLLRGDFLDATYGLAMQWLTRVNHGMTDKQIVDKMYD